MENLMKQVFPSYYNKFRCIAGDCRHSCCIGWEIDVDADTMQSYRAFPDILTHIDTEADPPHFRLTADERCPFLNECGLCDIILRHGEDHLCQICDDHPRFRNFFDSRTETGLGLCCEAAAALILGETEKVTLDITGEGDENDLEQEFFALRAEMFGILQNRERTIAERTEALLAFAESQLPEKSLTEWAAEIRALECLDPVRNDILDRIPDDVPFPEETFALPLEQLLVYFLYRHLAPAIDDGLTAARTAFAVLSTRMICAMAYVLAANSTITTEHLAEAARLYSSEIEYSEENLDELLWKLDDAQYN